MPTTPIDLVQGSAGVPLVLTVDSADPLYTFADVTGARVRIRKGSVGGGVTVERAADSFAVVAGDLLVAVTLLAADLNERGTLYVTAIAERAAGDLVAEERTLQIGV